MENSPVLETSDLLSKGVRKTKTKKGSRQEKIHNLVMEARASIVRLQNLRRYYEFVTEEELIDYAIYREKAEEERISYLLKKIKELEERDVI